MNYKIFENGEQINTIVADPEFVEAYCTEMGYTYEEEVREEEATDPESLETPTDSTDLETRITALESAIERGLSL